MLDEEPADGEEHESSNKSVDCNVNYLAGEVRAVQRVTAVEQDRNSYVSEYLRRYPNWLMI